ncbi:MAG: hypothetical protein KDA70_10490 [Planctomycetaceae bacterium]|nr:hypothetical protein [Planctomycetaceae bacterium]
MSIATTVFRNKGWQVHSWNYADQEVQVLHQEPFRLTWFATQLVTYVFIIERTPENYQSILDDYAALREFAGQHKNTVLPFGIQCGYALLPIYVGGSFSEELIIDVQNTYRKRWCVFHAPALLEQDTGKLHKLEAKSFWGCVYRDYIESVINETALVLNENLTADVV